VLIHGLGMSSRYLMPTAKLLSVHGKVYAPDLPGFGKSGKPSHIPTISELADFLAEWMAAVGIHSPVLIGNSLGAQVIVDFAVRHRTRLTAAVLVGPTIDPEARRMSTQIGRLLADVPREPPGLYGIAMTDYLRAGVGRCLRTLRHALDDPIAEKLPTLRVPVLIVRGERDPIVPQRWAERAAVLAPDAECVTIPGAAHAVNFNAPEALVKEVIEFMQQA
jgi:2-hydroxy-6-oxonona-2,4-dienedioate hydrolase